MGYLLVGILLIFSFGTHAMRLDYFDIDGALLHDSRPRNEDGTENASQKLPAFWAYWVLVRIDQVNNGLHVEKYAELEREGKLPYQILVNRHEMDRLRGLLATREGRAGDMREFKLMDDPIKEVASHPEKFKGVRPETIVPGFYMEVPQVTFMYHDDFKSGENNILNQLEAAVRRWKADPEHYEFRGEAFEQLSLLLPKQNRNQRIIFLTDRLPKSRDSLVEGLEFLSRRNLLSKPVPRIAGDVFPPKLQSTGGPYGRMAGSVFDFGHRKPTQIAHDVAMLANGPMEKHLTLSPDLNDALEGKQIMGHEIFVYENDPDYVAAHFNNLKELAATYRNIKFVLFHAGSARQVLGSDFNPSMASESASRWVVFMPNGKGWRLPTESELAEWEPSVNAKTANCARLAGGK